MEDKGVGWLTNQCADIQDIQWLKADSLYAICPSLAGRGTCIREIDPVKDSGGAYHNIIIMINFHNFKYRHAIILKI